MKNIIISLHSKTGPVKNMEKLYACVRVDNKVWQALQVLHTVRQPSHNSPLAYPLPEHVQKKEITLFSVDGENGFWETFEEPFSCSIVRLIDGETCIFQVNLKNGGMFQSDPIKPTE